MIAFTTTKANTTKSTIACTTGKSSRSTDCTSSEPMPARPKAASTIELATSRPATRRPLTVTIGPIALRKHVTAHDRAACEAATGGHLDVLATELVDHRRTGHLADQHDEDDRERDRGQHEVVDGVEEPLARAERREPAELHREHGDEHDRPHERRDRAEHREADEHRPVEHPPAVERRDDAADQSDDRDHQARHDHQAERHRESLADHGRHVLPVLQRPAEVALQHAAEPLQVLLPGRKVEPVLRGDLRDRLGAGLAPAEQEARPGRPAPGSARRTPAARRGTA